MVIQFYSQINMQYWTLYFESNKNIIFNSQLLGESVYEFYFFTGIPNSVPWTAPLGPPFHYFFPVRILIPYRRYYILMCTVLHLTITSPDVYSTIYMSSQASLYTYHISKTMVIANHRWQCPSEYVWCPARMHIYGGMLVNKGWGKLSKGSPLKKSPSRGYEQTPILSW